MGQQQTEMGSAVRRMVLVLLVAALTLVVVASATADPAGATRKGGGSFSKVQACDPIYEHVYEQHPEVYPEWCVKG